MGNEERTTVHMTCTCGYKNELFSTEMDLNIGDSIFTLIVNREMNVFSSPILGIKCKRCEAEFVLGYDIEVLNDE